MTTSAHHRQHDLRGRSERGRRALRLAVSVAIAVAAVLVYAFVLSRGAVL